MKKALEKVSQYELPIKISLQKDGGYLVTCSVWKDCYAQGKTIDEAVLEVTAVAQSLIELYKEENQTIPLRSITKQSLDNPFLMPVIVAS